MHVAALEDGVEPQLMRHMRAKRNIGDNLLQVGTIVEYTQSVAIRSATIVAY